MTIKTLFPLLLLIGCRDKGAASIDTSGVEETGPVSVDADGDGYDESEDCDDNNSVINPGAEEICDGIDNNCDGEIDEGVTSTYYADVDADGFGDPDRTTESCEVPEGYAVIGTDCDDGDPEVYPGYAEQCDGVDNDCDGEIDEDVRYDWYADADGDGFGDADSAFNTCDPPPGYVTDSTDCDDTEESAFPGGEEVCDEADNDCDGEVDENVTTTFYQDTDGDGFGVADKTTDACNLPTGYAVQAGDCDDTNGTISPNAAEICDDLDNDCDGNTDEDDAVDAETFYADTDSDGFGDADDTTEACEAPSGYVSDDTDCNDADGDISPDAEEVCDEVDNDCDGDIDTDATDMETFYADNDGDGYGGTSSTTACELPSGFVDNADDCDDGEADSNPGESEVCDDLDNDCDGDVDEGVTTTWYLDADADGYGNPDRSIEACSAPSGYVTDSADCDDLDADSSPDGTEVCDEADNDCDGDIDEDAASPETFYADTDGDGFGDADATTDACEAPSGYVSDDTDCDDTTEAANPDAAEVCDGIDNDCSGAIDEGLLGSGGDCPAESCAEVLDDGGSTGDGSYWLDPDSDGTAAEYECDMTTDGGGWTRVVQWDRVNDGDTLADFESRMTEVTNNMTLWTENSTNIQWADYNLEADVMAYEYAVEVPNGGEGLLDLDFDGTSMECSAVWFYIQDTSGTDTDLTCREDLVGQATCNSTGHGSNYYTTTEQGYEPGYSCSGSANGSWSWSGDFQSTASAEIDSFNIAGFMFDSSAGDQSYLYRFAFWVR